MCPEENRETPQTDQVISRSEIALLRGEVSDLKKSVEDETKGISGRVKRWGAGFGLLALIISLPRGVSDLYQLIWNKPNTQLFPIEILALSYEPNHRLLTFTLDFSANNTGTKDEILRPTRILIGRTDAQLAGLPFSGADLECSSQGVKLSGPFFVKINAPVSFSCNLGSNLPPTQEPFQKPGNYQLSVSLSSVAGREQNLEACFDLPESSLAEIFRSDKLQERRFIYPNCK
jgi:hypothetical protein